MSRYLIITFDGYIIDFYFKNVFIVDFIIFYIGSNDDVTDDCGANECEEKMDMSTISGKKEQSRFKINTNIFS